MAVCLLSLGAGVLSLLSPCVLPLLPLVLASAFARHRLGVLALAVGLTASATVFGLAFALLGLALDRDLVRTVAGALLIVLAAVLLNVRPGSRVPVFPRIEAAVVGVSAPVAAWAAARLERPVRRGLAGQMAVGALLGALWTPCGGPTLAAATMLAAQRESLPSAAAVMAAYSAGAAVPLLALAYTSGRALRRPDRVARLSHVGRPLLGVTLALTGLSTLTGADRAIEAAIAGRMPAWLIELTTRF
jgi:cytochrome c biogenesis protein CcdA